MYELLSRYIPEPWVQVVAVVWYVSLFVLMVATSWVTSPGFVYLNP